MLNTKMKIIYTYVRNVANVSYRYIGVMRSLVLRLGLILCKSNYSLMYNNTSVLSMAWQWDLP